MSRPSSPVRTGVLVGLSSAALATLIFAIQVLGAVWYRDLSIYDERGHIDYVLRLADGAPPVWGDRLTPQAVDLVEALCGSAADGSCSIGADRDPSTMWGGGYSYEAQQSPIGYWSYAIGARWLLGSDGDPLYEITRLRMFGLAGIAVFVVLWSVAMALLTRSRAAALAATAVVTVSPLVFSSFSYVTNDGAAINVGLLSILFTVAAYRLPYVGRWWLLVGALVLGVLIGLTKPTALVVPAALALAVWLAGRMRRHLSPPGLLTAGFVQIAVGAFTYASYSLWTAQRSSASSSVVLDAVLNDAGDSAWASAVGRVADGASIVIGSAGIPVTTVGIAFSLAGVVAFVVGAAQPRFTFRESGSMGSTEPAFAFVVGAIVVLVAVPLSLHLQGGYASDFVGRYLGPLLPIFAIATIAAFERFRRSGLVFAAAGVLAVALSVPSWDVVRGNIDGLARIFGL